MWRNTFWKFWKRWSGILIGLCLIVSGSLLLIFVRAGILRDFGTALLISGILTVTVDPYIKGKTQRETALDIFHHMLGYSLPEQIQDRLKHIVETTEWYRKGATMRCVVSEAGDFLVWDVELEYEIVNATAHTLGFRPTLGFERPERPVLKKVICFDDPEYGKDLALRSIPGEPETLTFRGEPLATASQGSRRLKYEFSVQYPTASGLFYHHFKYPTIGFALTIKSPETLTVTADGAELESPGEWRYVSRLFMPGEFIQVRWERAEKPQTSN
jgi:hypothetical protein